MRKRSGAYHADTQEDYLQLAIEFQYKENAFYNYEDLHLSRRREKTKKDKSPSNFQALENFGVLDSFDFEADNIDLCLRGSDCSDVLNAALLKNSPATLTLEAEKDSAIEGEFDSQPTKYERTVNCMLIGAPNVGKHELINNLFPSERGFDSEPLMKRLDLVIRKKETSNTIVTYKFWFKELVNDSYETLIKLYYKQCAIFIFVYDLTDRKSFEALGQEIDAIQEELGKKHYDMYLVGSHSDQEERRAVSYEEGVEMKMKYGLQHFTETNCFIEKETQQLLKKIDSQPSC